MVECPKETAYLFLHTGSPDACNYCLQRIGLYFYQVVDDEPYELPCHDHCGCSWELILLEGIFSTRKEELANDLAQAVAELETVNADIETCVARIEELTGQVNEALQAQAESLAAAAECLQKAEELVAEAEALLNGSDEVTDEIQEEIDYLEQQAEEALARAEELQDLADEYGRDAERLQAEKDGQDEMKATYELRKTELEKEIADLEDCLEIPVIEELAASIAGSRLVLSQ